MSFFHQNRDFAYFQPSVKRYINIIKFEWTRLPFNRRRTICQHDTQTRYTLCVRIGKCKVRTPGRPAADQQY